MRPAGVWLMAGCVIFAALSLVMAMTGRKTPLDDLTGDGVATLRSRS